MRKGQEHDAGNQQAENSVVPFAEVAGQSQRHPGETEGYVACRPTDPLVGLHIPESTPLGLSSLLGNPQNCQADQTTRYRS